VHGFFVTGTDTDVGKTVVSAWLVARLGAFYWKPVQAGNHPEIDSAIVRRLTGLPPDRILPEAYVLPEPIAPHEAARRAGITIDMERLVPPPCNRPLVVEGAGGLMVPLTDRAYVIDLATELHLPIILVTRSTLGTINHTLLRSKRSGGAAAPRRGGGEWTETRIIAPRSSATARWRSSPKSPGSIN
jgi:dethiobiotin synthase